MKFLARLILIFSAIFTFSNQANAQASVWVGMHGIQFLLFSLFLSWLILCGLAAWIAAQKGLSAVETFLLAFFLSPLVGIIVALVNSSQEQCDIERARLLGAYKLFLKCPSCLEVVRMGATKCRYCHSALSPTVEQSPDPTPAKEPTKREVIFHA